MPRSALNLILFIISVATIRYVAWYFFDWTIENSELLTTFGLVTASSIGFSLISDPTKDWFKTRARKFFSSKKSSKYFIIVISLLAAPSLLVGRIDLTYKSSQHPPPLMNGIFINERFHEKATRITALGFSLSKASLSIGRFSASKKYLPFVKAEINIPYGVITESDIESQRIERELSYAFFQFYESKHLANAKSIISAQASDQEKKEALSRLSLIEQILELSIVGGDVSETRADLLNRFHTEYANDAWTNALDAAVEYSNSEYSKASQKLSIRSNYEPKWPGSLATEFFKSVCLLKSSRKEIEPKRSELLSAALDGFKLTETMAANEPDPSFRSHALASAIIFQAIHYFYLQDIPHAKTEFMRAAQVSTGSLRARALNGAGYLEFVEGNLDKAEVDFLDALESDPHFAYALSNYGYVLMAKDKYKSAIHYFEQNSTNSELRATSPRDVLLAELAIGHANEELKSETHSISNYYASTLKSWGYRDFSAVTPAELRLAYQYTEMAEKIYLNKDYYGLEVFSLALLEKAKALLGAHSPNDVRYQALSKKIDSLIVSTRPNVPIAWLKGTSNRGAFFSYIKNH